MTQLLRPCIDCGELSDKPYCAEHQAPHPTKPHAAKDYDWNWQKLSRRARRLQPFCSDCGATDDLQGDHSPEAWERKEQGLPIRLQDIDVRCGDCNRKQGSARGSQVTWGLDPTHSLPHPAAKAKSQILRVSGNSGKEV